MAASHYATLAQLVRYENVHVSLKSPQFAAAMAKLEANDHRFQETDFTLTDLEGKLRGIGLHPTLVSHLGNI